MMPDPLTLGVIVAAAFAVCALLWTLKERKP